MTTAHCPTAALDTPSPLPAASCPGCGGSAWFDFFTVNGLPVHVGILGRTRADALAAPRGDIQLSYCRGCGLVHNRRFDLALTSFEPGYEIALQHSTVFREFLHEVAQRLAQCYDLDGKTILEIGCGNGYFLRLLTQMAGAHGVGVDPTVAYTGIEERGKSCIQWIRDFYCTRYRLLPIDFICCLSVFEDVPQPLSFLRELRSTIGDRPIPVYFEVFNSHHALARGETWSIHYEQCNYFELESYRALFQRAGFRVERSGTCYQDGQYLYVEAMPGEPCVSDDGQFAKVPDEIISFAACHEQKLRHWEQQLAEYVWQGKKAVLWGSGGKGISFLNAVAPQVTIDYVVDINPARQGRYIPVTGQEIIAPERLPSLQPDVIVLTNSLYEAEIRQQAAALGLQCEFAAI